MSYAMLLEDYNAEQEIANATFASIAENVNAIHDLIAEDVTLDFSVALESSSDVNALKEAAEEAKKNAFTKLGERLKTVFEKLVTEAKKILQKALIAAANKGNEAMKKLISEKAKTKKEVKLKTPTIGDANTKGGVEKINAVINALKKFLKDFDASKAAQSGFGTNAQADALDAAFKDSKVETKDLVEPAGKGVSELYNLYAAPYIEKVDYRDFNKTINDAANDAKKVAEVLKGSKLEESSKDAAMRLMKAGSALVNFNFQVLSIGVANAAKIALAAAGIKTVKAEKEEEKKEEK